MPSPRPLRPTARRDRLCRRMRKQRLAMLTVASVMPALFVGCGGGDTATSVRAGQQQEGGALPVTTTEPESDSAATAPSAVPEESEERTSPTTPELPRSGPTPSTPEVEPLEAQLANNNVRDGGLGSVCWGRWEVNRQIRIGISNVETPEGKAVASGAVETLRTELLPTLESELGQVMSKLQPDVRAFITRFATDVALARELVTEQAQVQPTLDALARQFDFDSYPDVEKYRELAASNPSCVHP